MNGCICFGGRRILHRNFHYLVNTFNLWNICDRVGSTFIFVGFDLSLENKTCAVGSKSTCGAFLRSEVFNPADRLCDVDVMYLLCMSFRILHIDEDFSAAGFHGVYSEHSRLQHLVAVRLDTCNDTRGETFCSACGRTRINTSLLKVRNCMNYELMSSSELCGPSQAVLSYPPGP